MGARHLGQRIGVLRVLPERGAQGEDRLLRLVRVDQPARLQLQGLRIGGVGLQHPVHQRARLGLVAAVQEHLRKRHTVLAGLRAFLGTLECGAHPFDAVLGLPGLERHRGDHGGVETPELGVLVGGLQALQLGARGLGALGGHQEADDLDVPVAFAGIDTSLGAQQRFGLGVVPLHHVPADQCLPQLAVVGVEPDHALQLRAGGLGLAGLGEDAQLQQVEVLGLGVHLERGVDGRQRDGRILGRGLVVDDDAQQDVALRGALGALSVGQLLRFVGDPGAFGVIALQRGGVVVQRQQDRMGPCIVERPVPERLTLSPGLLPVAGADRHFGERHAHVHGIGIAFDQRHVGAEGLAHVALIPHDVGIGPERVLVVFLVPEDIEELDQRAVFVVLFEEGHAGAEMDVGLFLGALAAGKKQAPA